MRGDTKGHTRGLGSSSFGLWGVDWGLRGRSGAGNLDDTIKIGFIDQASKKCFLPKSGDRTIDPRIHYSL